MKITVCKVNNDNDVAAEFNIKLVDQMFVITPSIYDNIFLHLYDDLMYIRTKWMTHYLNYACYNETVKPLEELEKEIIDDVLTMLEHELIYRKSLGGSYKIVCV